MMAATTTNHQNDKKPMPPPWKCGVTLSSSILGSTLQLNLSMLGLGNEDSITSP
jgi:hypothetical protein